MIVILEALMSFGLNLALLVLESHRGVPEPSLGSDHKDRVWNTGSLYPKRIILLALWENHTQKAA